MDLIRVFAGLFGLYSGGRALLDGLGGDLGTMKGRVHEVKNLDERVGYIVKMIRKGKLDARVKALTVKLLSRKDANGDWVVPEKNWHAEVVTIFKFVRSKLRYVHDAYGVDQYTHPIRSFQMGGVDCDDAAIVLGSMLQAVGYEVRLRVVRSVGADDWDHIYLLVRIKDRWWALDASVDQPAGWEVPRGQIAAIRDYEVPA